jgi:hypothetical protein
VLRETTSRGLCGLGCPSRTVLPIFHFVSHRSERGQRLHTMQRDEMRRAAQRVTATHTRRVAGRIYLSIIPPGSGRTATPRSFMPSGTSAWHSAYGVRTPAASVSRRHCYEGRRS